MNKAPQPNLVRIIGGRFRSRKLKFPNSAGLRPTGDRIRETLFNWLAPVVSGAHCLDLFAGSGALGIEALSRGAAHTTFIDSSPLVCKSLRNNLNMLDPELLRAGTAAVSCTDSLAWLSVATDKSPKTYDIIFLDPPFSEELLEASYTALATNQLLAKNCLIYTEQALQEKIPDIPDGWQIEKEKQTGNVRYQLLKRA